MHWFCTCVAGDSNTIGSLDRLQKRLQDDVPLVHGVHMVGV